MFEIATKKGKIQVEGYYCTIRGLEKYKIVVHNAWNNGQILDGLFSVSEEITGYAFVVEVEGADKAIAAARKLIKRVGIIKARKVIDNQIAETRDGLYLLDEGLKEFH